MERLLVPTSSSCSSSSQIAASKGNTVQQPPPGAEIILRHSFSASALLSCLSADLQYKRSKMYRCQHEIETIGLIMPQCMHLQYAWLCLDLRCTSCCCVQISVWLSVSCKPEQLMRGPLAAGLESCQSHCGVLLMTYHVKALHKQAGRPV